MTQNSTSSKSNFAEDILAIDDLEKRSREERIRDFTEILDRIEDLDDKKKVLWKEIYNNAITDRQNAFAMFAKLARICEDKTSEHAIHGKTMATFLERMSRANDQLIKLVEVIRRAEEESENIDSDEMFNKIRS